MANCVYRLLCLDKNIKEFYIGSTADLKQRIGSHKSSCNNSNSLQYNLKVYKFIREHGGWNSWAFDIELLTTGMEEKDRKQLEQNYIDCLHPHLNSCNALGLDMEKKKESKKKYYNKESVKEYHKEYREDNKDKIKEYIKDYHQNNKESIKEQRKQYREKNKESIKDKKKEYREKNKESINATARERYMLKKTKVI
tara:strand:+ start:186 stop:773 length:588 start_codon:yes stop_codon:yes gene_type:complete